jgi:hypothetical protein
MADTDRDAPGGARAGDESDGGSEAPPPGWRSPPAAVYGLEHPVACPSCGAELDQVFVVRLFRARAHFMSSLPRSGRLIVCPGCRSVLPGELGSVL